MTIEPRPAGPTFARCALQGAHAGPNGRTATYIYTRNLKFAQLVTALASLAGILENATALGSRIPPHAVFLHVNNTPVKLKLYSLFKKDVSLRNVNFKCACPVAYGDIHIY